MTIQLERHMVEHESAEEEDMHSVQDDPFLEGQSEDHIEPVMEED